MRLYQINKGKLTKIKEEPFKLERDLQRLVENNLETLMGLQVIKSEFSIKDKRFDTLSYDPESKSFVIIEYKRDRNSSVVDQGIAYLHLLINNKAEAILEANERLGTQLKKAEVNWDMLKVVFVASSFTDNQIQATDDKGLPIELWEVKKYGKDFVSVNVIKKSGANESINLLTKKSEAFKTVAKEVKVYTEEDHLSCMPEDIKELYRQFKEAILNLDEQIEVQAKKNYMAFKKNGSNISDIEIWKKQLKIYANAKWGELDDPKGLFENVSETGTWGNGDYRVNVSDSKNLEYIMSVLKQLL